jgi:hypothetical protein
MVKDRYVCAVSDCNNWADHFFWWDGTRFLVLCDECNRRASFSKNPKAELSTREEYEVFLVMQT